MNHFPRWSMQVLFAHIFVGLGIPHYLWVLTFRSCVAHERRRRIFDGSDAAATHQKEHMTGNGKQLFHFFHQGATPEQIAMVQLYVQHPPPQHAPPPLRCSSANELRESTKPDGREAFRSLNVLPQNNAQHSLFRTTESVTTHSVHWVSAFVQESGFVKDLGEFLGRNQGEHMSGEDKHCQPQGCLRNWP